MEGPVTRRATIEALRRELAGARREQLRLLAVLAVREEQAAAAAVEIDALAVRAARAEARALNLHAMCPDRATCTANTDAAGKWRHEHPAYGGGIGPMP